MSNIDRLIDRASKAHHHVPEGRCPACNDTFTCHGGVNTEEAPEAGDVSICAYCGAILRFGVDLTVDLCPVSELEEMKAEQPDNYETLINLQHKVRELAQQRRRMNVGRN